MNNFLNILSLAALFILLPLTLTSQADCADPLVLCGESPFTITPSIENAVEDDLSNVCSAMNLQLTESAPVWVELNIESGGELVFTITPPEENRDIDFFVFKMVDECDSKESVRCMLSGETAGQESDICLGPTGLAFGETDVEELPGCSDGNNNFLAPLVVESGEKYLILINDFSFSGNPYEIEFGGTASLDCITSSVDGVNEQQASVIIAPNISSTGIFSVEFNLPISDFNFSIYDSAGRPVLQKLNQNGQNQVVDLADQPKGIYYLIMDSGQLILSEHLVIIE